MKNLKLFAVPFLAGAALLASCGAKPMEVKDFKPKVEEKFNLGNIKTNYKGKKLHVTGKEIAGDVDRTGEISDVVIPIFGGVYYVFTYTDATFKPTTMHDFYILSPKLIDSIEENKTKTTGLTVTVNYFISGDTYTVERISEVQGSKTTEKFVYNKDLVITSSEMNGSGSGQSISTRLDYKYE